MLTIFLRKKPFFTRDELLRFANIADNAGQVIFGVGVLAPLLAGIDRVNIPMVGSGIVGMIVCWALSIFFTRKANHKQYGI